MSIEHYIVKYFEKANEFMKESLDFHFKNTNNIDEVIKENVQDFTDNNSSSELNDELLYHHLKANKVLSQLAWNSYRNHLCFSNCEIDEKYFCQICHHLENEEFYKNEFEKIKNGIEYNKASIIGVISRYFIIFCILNSREVDVENIKTCVYCDNEEIKDICSICGGDTFNYKDVNYVQKKVSKSNNYKSSDQLEQSNSNLKNKNIICHKENLASTENIEDNKLNFNSEFAKVERFDNLSKENEDFNGDKLLSLTCRKSSFNRNEEIARFSTTNKMDSVGNKENVSALTDVNKDPSLSSSNIDAMVTNQWTCTQCSFINNEDDDICEVCLTNKSNVKNYDLPEETWNCKKCNERNPLNCYKCSKCINLDSCQKEVSASNKKKSFDQPEEINPNLKNENINCQNENLLNTVNKLIFNSEYIPNSVSEAENFDQCVAGKTIDCDKTAICEIKSPSLDTLSVRSSPSFCNESQLSYNISNKNYTDLANVERLENLSINNENEDSNGDLINSFNRNEKIVQSSTLCMTDRLDSVSSKENVSVLTDINKDSSIYSSNIDAMDTNQWTCTQCSFINNDDNDICELCFTNKSNVNNFDLPEETWNCRKCNERNPFNCYKCSKCGAFSDFYGKWVCEQCSYFNNKLERNCCVCEMQNQCLVKCPECNRTIINIKYDDICNSCVYGNDLTEKLSQLSINSYGNDDTMVKSNSKTSTTSNEIDKKGTNQINFESNRRELKILIHRWYCRNPKCCGINFSAAKYCDRCRLKKNSYLVNGAKCAFYKNDREVHKWYCSKCENFNNSSSSPCSVCKCYIMRVTTV